MKICMPTTGKNGLNEMVHNHFGSAQYFTIYDTESKTIQTITNGNLHHSHGSCQPIEAISQNNINIVITSGMGIRAIKLLNDNGVKVFLSKGEIVSDVINNFESGLLSELTFEHACSHHGCH
jgi:predicted Fe-Mo cluster-binding NifX family protein